jgi:signal transduction histidine kinase/ligand-binding sensor domain-containing protein
MTASSHTGCARRLSWWLFVLLFVAMQAGAQRSYFTLYDRDYGLNVGEIAALAQDDTGFIWIGAHRGLIRFDGRNFVPWAPEVLDEVVYQILAGPDDQLLVRAASGRGWRRTTQGLDPLPGPDGAQLTQLGSFAFDASGVLWAVIRDELWQRDGAANWRRIENGIPPADKARRIYAFGTDVVVLTDQAAWVRQGTAAWSELLRAKDLWFAARGADASIWLATHFNSGLWRVDAQGVHAIGRPGARALDLRPRGGTMWLALDQQLLAYAPDGVMRRMTIDDGLPSGGPLLVDRENSLWLGTFIGLLQFPQPDTLQWNQRDGLPSEHAYAIVEHEGVVFASTWGGLAHMNAASDGRFVVDFQTRGGVVCVDAQRGVLTSDGDHLAIWHGSRFDGVGAWGQNTAIGGCARDASGTLWLATSSGLFRWDGMTLDHVALDRGDDIDQVWFDGGAVMRGAFGDSVCRVQIRAGNVASTEDCRSLPTTARANAIARVSPQTTWIVANDGIFAFDGDDAKRLVGNHLIEGGKATSITPAPGGDWWAAGPGVLQRIHPCGDCAAGWEIREAPGRWQGLPGNSAIGVSENAEGDLWVAGNRGVWKVPRAVRETPSDVPRVVPVRVSIDGATGDPGATITMRPDAHRLELEFEALTFRDRSLLRFRSRLLGHDAWSAPTRSSVLQFAALEPGGYGAEMAASLDGEHWSEPAATVEFSVLPPWYRTWWARALFALAALALGAWIYRLRVAALLRVERERTRIAMDLHDELGSGLGSIGMLAGVAAREDLAAGEQRRLMREIANLSGLLGSGLRSLVWSLRSGRAGVAELGTQIADHARRLFPGDAPRLSVQLPSDPSDGALPPEVRRNVLLFTLEALHNVARHARAANVKLLLETRAGGGLRLVIEDDGCGFDPGGDAQGTGVLSMRRRAAALGATLAIESAPGRGTRVALDCTGGIA